ncbi:hypothetical protein SDRG_04801 [Saprolegnia diclina VS20]|uniref:Uncharacterized protein n=1 Tax=Saprolegnia diclina (strain VS20) TaxID=1156394 RepID=T0QID4_SAPDV|nr:hypothetical protein SDRG_04801 [Saprolegnia diclina VS20]EQC37774.1 hypothetical protein SDRG_04801 [Saprolegnia diclina VS20]|eukprot:XP_008608707.1 hypothetical protein SDRG_04801 [Saprolegnia diclina VS20]
MLRVGFRGARGVHAKAIPAVALKQHKKTLTPDKFKALSLAFLDKVEAAVAPLLPPVNENFVVQRTTSPPKLVLQTTTHEFEIAVLAKPQKIEFTSPISGLRTYIYNGKTQRWEDETDRHDVEGLLTRDLMRTCTGIPTF